MPSGKSTFRAKLCLQVHHGPTSKCSAYQWWKAVLTSFGHVALRLSLHAAGSLCKPDTPAHFDTALIIQDWGLQQEMGGLHGKFYWYLYQCKLTCVLSAAWTLHCPNSRHFHIAIPIQHLLPSVGLCRMVLAFQHDSDRWKWWDVQSCVPVINTQSGTTLCCYWCEWDPQAAGMPPCSKGLICAYRSCLLDALKCAWVGERVLPYCNHHNNFYLFEMLRGD